jgi:Protein of unknown function (DUF2510)
MMYYGHGSWIALVVFGGLFAFRMLAAQRRRGGRGAPGPGRSFTGDHRPAPPGVRPAPPVAGGTSTTGTAPGWFTDPFVRHEQRYWSGTEWTEHVTDQGSPGTDPPPADPGRRRDGGPAAGS